MDIVTREKRSAMMSGIKGRNTKPEIIVRSLLFNLGFRFRLHRRDLPGKPDIVLPKYRVAIFVHGCFWHVHDHCRLSKIPESNVDFWKAKLLSNRERDRQNREKLQEAGWRVLTIWECVTKTEATRKSLGDAVSTWIRGNDPSAQIPDFSNTNQR